MISDQLSAINEIMQLPVIVEELAGLPREREPLTVGLPLARGALSDPTSLRLIDEQGATLPTQLEALNRWADGSVRWVLLDTLIDVDAKGRRTLSLATVPDAPPTSPLIVEAGREEIRIHTGVVEATLPRSGSSLLTRLRNADGAPLIQEDRGLEMLLSGAQLEPSHLSLTCVDLLTAGPVRTTVEARGRLGEDLEVAARLSFWSGRGLIRLDLTVRNPRPASHPGNTWDLGDPGSVLLNDLSLRATMPRSVEPRTTRWCDEAVGPLRETEASRLEIYQDSSGGEHWDFPTHLDRNHVVPHSFRGYRVTGSLEGCRGDRASPSLWLSRGDQHLGATIREFWQCFPKALESSGRELFLRLWPGQFDALHELQGGEQKTHTTWLSIEPPQNLGWVQSPLIGRSTPEYYVASGVFHNLIEQSRDENDALLDLAAVVIDEKDGLMARREVIDEFGWRNFGDAWADHENVGNDGPRPRVSHYNNQYDGILGMLAQFVRSGDARWYRLADEMARHVADIDVYHTEGDRSAFSGGLFWHTDHYTDAVTSSHRCYTNKCPAAEAGSYGGGPSAEQDYAGGLATHYLMTGWRPSRESALSLADWVIRMDGPEDTGVGKLLPGPSGLATRTDDHSYHGPGRGAGNSLDTLLDAYGLTENDRYLNKTEELIRRVVHPDDDRDDFELLTNPETRWSYVVVLLALIRYLEVKVERGELDDRYAYAQASLVSYGRWMMDHETLSSGKKDLLEIWSESWPAQDLRKGLVLMQVARHLDNEGERSSFHRRGAEFFEQAQDDLLEWETRTLTRPLFLVMRYGYQGSSLIQRDHVPPARIVHPGDIGHPSGFVPWKGLPTTLIKKFKHLLGR